MQIILTCNYSPWSAYSGGGQQSTHELATALVRRGHGVTVVFTKTLWERVRPLSSLPYYLYGGDLIRRAYQLSAQRIHSVHNGVPAEFLKHEWRPCVGRDTRSALFFGRFERSKGSDVLLRALHELGQDAPHVRFVGRGTHRATMARMREDLGLTSKVVFREWVGHRELGRLLAQSSMAILPSRGEDFAWAALAAMAVGTPLITTNAGGVAELVEHGESGVLCPAGDATALSDAVLQLRRRPEWASALGARARGRVRDNFTWEVAVRKFESLYGQLV
jgi:glycogen synthase